MKEHPPDIEYVEPGECGRDCQLAIAGHLCPAYTSRASCPVFEKELKFYLDTAEDRIAALHAHMAGRMEQELEDELD